MKLYVVSADVFEDVYGAQISLLGIFSSEQKAIECMERNKKYNCNCEITELDKEKAIYLGGYIE